MGSSVANIMHHFGGGVYAKETRVPAGYVLVQHAHKHDHLSILAEGSAEVMVDGERVIYTAPTCITIEAGKHHGVKSLTDVVWYCIHATDCVNEDEIDEVLMVPDDATIAQSIVDTLLTKEN